MQPHTIVIPGQKSQDLNPPLPQHFSLPHPSHTCSRALLDEVGAAGAAAQPTWGQDL